MANPGKKWDWAFKFLTLRVLYLVIFKAILRNYNIEGDIHSFSQIFSSIPGVGTSVIAPACTNFMQHTVAYTICLLGVG